MSRMTLSIIAQFTDRASRGMKSLLRLGRQQERMQKAYGRASRQAAQSQQRLARASGDVARAMQREGAAAQRLRAALARVNAMIRRQVSLRERLRRAGSLAREGLGRMGRAGAMAAGIYGTVQASAASAASLVVGPAAQVEQYRLILETVQGSAEKAKKSLEWVTTFAVKTPYELNEVMESFVKLQSYGLDPTNGLLKTLGDTAAAMGKPLMQAVEAIADAVTGENERLKEFGIKARAQGKYFYYEYTQNGVTKVAKALKSDRAQIQRVLSDIFNAKYAGAMERLSQSWTGMMSNLSDMWFKFRLMVAQSGVFEFLKGKLRLVLDELNRLEQAGKLQEIARQIGDSIISGLKAMWQFGLGVWAVLKKVGAALAWAAEKLGGWNNLAMVLMALPLTSLFASAASGALMLGRALMLLAANPVTLLVAGLAAAAAWLVDWPALIGAVRNAWKKFSAALGNIDLSGIMARLRGMLSAWGRGVAGMARGLASGIGSTMGWLGPVSERLGRAWSSLSRAGRRLLAVFGELGGSGALERLYNVLGKLIGLGLGALALALEGVAHAIDLLSAGIAAVVSGGSAFIGFLAALPQRAAAAWQAFVQWLSQPFDPFPGLRQKVQDIIASLTASFRVLDIGALINPVNWPGLLMRGLQSAINAVRNAFAGIDLFDAGIKALQSFWNGMKQVMAGLAGWAKKKLASIFTLPDWAKNWFGGGKQPAAQKTQARASGGAYGRGPLLVGERGPELIYASRSGWVAHNDNLRRLADLSRRAAASLAAAGMAGQMALAAPAIEPVSPGPAAIAGAALRAPAAPRQQESRVEVRYAPQITVHGNADPAQIRAALDAHLDELLDRLERRQRERERLDF